MAMRSLDHLVRSLLKQRRHAEAGRLAVLRLITTSNLTGSWTGLVGLRALENKIGISLARRKIIAQVDAVGDEAPSSAKNGTDKPQVDDNKWPAIRSPCDGRS
jgi:hypothetical protein